MLLETHLHCHAIQSRIESKFYNNTKFYNSRELKLRRVENILRYHVRRVLTVALIAVSVRVPAIVSASCVRVCLCLWPFLCFSLCCMRLHRS